MEQTTVTYQCPNCGAALSFDAEKQKFTCEFCMSEFDRSELEEAHASEQAQAAEENARDFCDHMLEYHCPSCGAEITADENTAADFCYYCHNPVLLTGKLSGQMKPDKIIPFRYNKQQAEERFLKDVKRKWFIPRDFFLPGQTEKFSGVYFPFWITDADTKSYAKGKATRTRVWQDSRYRYTETSHYLIEREGNIHFEDIVTSAISDGDKAMLEGILPYPSEALQDFSMPYLSGFTAKKRNIEREARRGAQPDAGVFQKTAPGDRYGLRLGVHSFLGRPGSEQPLGIFASADLDSDLSGKEKEVHLRHERLYRKGLRRVSVFALEGSAGVGDRGRGCRRSGGTAQIFSVLRRGDHVGSDFIRACGVFRGCPHHGDRHYLRVPEETAFGDLSAGCVHQVAVEP